MAASARPRARHSPQLLADLGMGRFRTPKGTTLAQGHLQSLSTWELPTVVTAMGWGGSGNRQVPAIDPAAWFAMGLTTARLAALVPVTEEHLAETMYSFSPNREGPP